jgi:predicted Ser/Thr protein kinase
MSADLEPTARRYQLLEVIGRGGFGTVYKAEMRGAGGFVKTVALKMLHTDQRETVARLRDEARMLGLLRHRAIVQVDDLVRLDGRWAIVMEYHAGASLDALDAPMPLSAALDVVGEVCAALDAAFTQEVGGRPLALLHRDLKPSNVLVEPDGRVVLLDFGVARAAFDAREARSRAHLVGTPFYMAPERFALRDTHAGDVFALGVTLVELVCGPLDTPCDADAVQHAVRMRTLLEALFEHTQEEALVDAVRPTLAWSPDDRPTARAFAESLAPVRGSLGGPSLASWAAANVSRLAARRDPLADPLAGTLLQEELTPESSHTVYVDPDTVATPLAPPPRARRSGGCGCAVGSGVGCLVAAVLFAAIACGLGAVAAAVGTSTLFEETLRATIERGFIDAAAQLDGVTPEKNRALVRPALKRGALAARDGKIGVMESIAFQVRFEASVKDRVLADAEARALVRHVDRIAAD